MTMGRLAHHNSSMRRGRRTTTLALVVAIAMVMGLIATDPAGAGAASTRIVIVGGSNAVSNAVRIGTARSANAACLRARSVDRDTTAGTEPHRNRDAA